MSGQGIISEMPFPSDSRAWHEMLAEAVRNGLKGTASRCFPVVVVGHDIKPRGPHGPVRRRYPTRGGTVFFAHRSEALRSIAGWLRFLIFTECLTRQPDKVRIELLCLSPRPQTAHGAVLRHHSYRGVQRSRGLPCAASVRD